jgi:hypothetical protein
MATMEFFVVSEGVSVDKFTNQLSLFNVLEQAAGTDFPFVLPFIAAVSLWIREAGDDNRDFQCMLRVTLPNGRQREFTSNFTFNARRHRVIQRLQGFPIDKPGVLRFEVLLNGEHKASHEIDVIKISDTEQSTTPEAE